MLEKVKAGYFWKLDKHGFNTGISWVRSFLFDSRKVKDWKRAIFLCHDSFIASRFFKSCMVVEEVRRVETAVPFLPLSLCVCVCVCVCLCVCWKVTPCWQPLCQWNPWMPERRVIALRARAKQAHTQIKDGLKDSVSSDWHGLCMAEVLTATLKHTR